MQLQLACYHASGVLSVGRSAGPTAIDVVRDVMNFLAVFVRNDRVVGRPSVGAQDNTVLAFWFHKPNNIRAWLTRRDTLRTAVARRNRRAASARLTA